MSRTATFIFGGILSSLIFTTLSFITGTTANWYWIALAEIPIGGTLALAATRWIVPRLGPKPEPPPALRSGHENGLYR